MPPLSFLRSLSRLLARARDSVKSTLGLDGAEQSGDEESQAGAGSGGAARPVAGAPGECYACTQPGVPAFHSTTCDQVHSPCFSSVSVPLHSAAAAAMAMTSTHSGSLCPGGGILRARAPAGLGHLGLGPSRSALRPVHSLALSTRRGGGGISAAPSLLRCAAASSASPARPASAPRFIQHKKEAFWFYRFLSIVYDHVINPGHWTEDMRDDALEPADLHSRKLKVVDVGGGTGFTTLGIVKHVDKENVTLLDQSPHQLEKARQKEALNGVEIMEGDAEDLPFPTDTFDRYVSAGSIEYWPDPQRGIKEAYRVLRLGGKACLIGPVHPTFWLSRFFADMWMLFPTEEEYIEWFKNAGFRDVQLKRIGPKWYRGVRRHGLIMGCSVTGVKRESGDSPLQLGPKAEDVSKPVNPITFFFRFLMGTICAAYYVLVPIYMWIKDQIVPKGMPI